MKNIIFLHIPKAGGTTLHSIIEKQYKKENIFTIDGKNIDETTSLLINTPPSKKKKIKCLKGHMYYGLHKYFQQKFNYITFLRDPIERTISEYYYLKYISKNKLHKIILKEQMTLLDYVKSDIAINTDNIQTRLIGGSGEKLLTNNPLKITQKDLDNAIFRLKNKFKFVGLLEEYDKSLILTKKIFHWKNIYYYKINVNPRKKQNISNKTIEIIKNKNKYDIALYKFAKKNFNKQVEQYKNNLSKDLKNFQKRNNALKFYFKTRYKTKTFIKRLNKN